MSDEPNCYYCGQPVLADEPQHIAGPSIACHYPPHPCGEATTVHGPGDNVEYNLPREP